VRLIERVGLLDDGLMHLSTMDQRPIAAVHTRGADSVHETSLQSGAARPSRALAFGARDREQGGRSTINEQEHIWISGARGDRTCRLLHEFPAVEL
jgi:hypothetical protein